MRQGFGGRIFKKVFRRDIGDKGKQWILRRIAVHAAGIKPAQIIKTGGSIVAQYIDQLSAGPFITVAVVAKVLLKDGKFCRINCPIFFGARLHVFPNM